ncbi:hypothetical protein GQ55_1G320100 [Panicum hallii var. hallii]|uniref:Uncharacterized protein n=1 Tax=Panicum hallii var. hallii TaxID=1504633 RepID=A0A2T7F9Q6_9POAL|nr:hypothetical protein GQ55_1G320100 [Panicum hallii var. hallii]
MLISSGVLFEEGTGFGKMKLFVKARNQQATQIGEAVEQDSHVHAMELSFLSVCIKYHCLVGDLEEVTCMVRCTKTLAMV